jgi:hypothetical protein
LAKRSFLQKYGKRGQMTAVENGGKTAAKSAAKRRQKRRPRKTSAKKTAAENVGKKDGQTAAKSAAKISGQTAAALYTLIRTGERERFALTTALGYAGRHHPKPGRLCLLAVIQNGSGKNGLVLFRRKTRVSSKKKKKKLGIVTFRFYDKLILGGLNLFKKLDCCRRTYRNTIASRCKRVHSS